MKTNKKIALLLVLVMIAAMLTGCASKDKDETKALTEQEYEDAVAELGEKLNAFQNDIAAVDSSDEEAAKKLLEEMKEPFSDFMAITPPEKYEDAHEKMKSGSQAMLDVFDILIDAVGETDAAKAQESSEKMLEKFQVAVTDLTEASELLAEAE